MDHSYTTFVDFLKNSLFLATKVTNIKRRLIGLHGNHLVPLKSSGIQSVAIPRRESLPEQTVED
jgi:hypothetical protein